ncbi:PD-(D/E)XK motif protein [Streptomyces sp. NPDC059757]|uniref:PD-(D/E)XK motif protein n=1 Tax=Streptomyces sp. NPDC059757 TaxID=3346935 RepID=UPI00364E6502
MDAGFGEGRLRRRGQAVIDEGLWRELEIPQPDRGRSTRRLFPESPHDIHLGVTHPGRRRMLLLRGDGRAADHVRLLITDLPQTHGLHLSCSSLSPRDFELQIILTTDDLREVFNPLVEDIARTVSTTHGDTVLEAAVRRFMHWQRLMRSVGVDGLSKQSRRGLYGELHFLREHLLNALPQTVALEAWTGPEGTNQDFQLPTSAVEIKTTVSKAPGRVKITSERQLDDKGAGRLFLMLLVLDERRGGTGESLNATVDSIRYQLSSPSAAARLETQLARAGYFSHQRGLYDEPRYTLRRADVWRVGDGFPRIVESDLPAGVGNCSYEVSVSELKKHRTTTDEVIELIRGTDG